MSFSWGDGTGSFHTGSGTIIASGTDIAGQGYVIKRTKVVHTYAGDGPYTLSSSSCCRISGLVNASNAWWTLRSVVDLRNGNQGSPVSSIPVILQMSKGGVNTVPLPVADPDGSDPITVRMATSAESSIPSVPSAGGHTLSVSPSGVLTWNTSGTSVGQRYAAQVILEDNHSGGLSSAPLDFMIEIVAATANQPPTCSGGQNVTASVGTPVSVTVTGVDPEGGTLRVNHLGLPAGATLTPAAGTVAGSPLAATFNWTPGLGDIGSANSVTLTFTDSAGLQTQCSITITVPANQPPSANAGPDRVVTADASCNVGVTLSGSGSDPEGGPLTYTWSGPFGTVTGQSPTVPLTKGIHTITLTVTDNKGATATDAVVVTVNDATPPTLTLQGPTSMTVPCNGTFTDPGATATDTCGSATVNVSGAVNTSAVGTYALTYVAVDASGNQSTPQTRTVNVVDQTPPTINCPANIVVNTEPGKCTANVGYSILAADACSAVSLTLSASGATSGPVGKAGGTFNKGTTTVTAMAVDAHGNAATCSFTVTVQDNEPPVLTVPASIVVGADAGKCDAVVNFTVSATDNCPGLTVVSSPASGSTFPKGTTTVTSTATDASGKVTTRTFTVTVEDREAPVIASPGDIVAKTAPGTCAANVSFAATAKDNCPGVTITYSHAPGSSFNKGDTIVTATATDASGRTASTTFKVTVNDVEAPVVSAAKDLTVECDGGGNTSALSAWLASNGGATATDNCGDVKWSHNFTALSDGCGATGTATVVFTATDGSGNTTTTTATVTVVDTTAPKLVAAASDQVVECDGSGNTAALKAWLASNGGASAKDLCGNVSWSHNFGGLSDGPGSTGSATVTFVATDECGNATSTTATFSIADTKPPVVSTPASSKKVECDGAGNTAALSAWLASNGGAVASDACGKVTWSHNFNALSDECGATGSATVTFTATDENGNSSSTTATFTIVDTQGPVITAQASSQTVECDGAGNSAALQAWLASNGGAAASDACGSFTWSHNFKGLTDLCGSTGSATVTFTATDACGNSSSTTATFAIVDKTPPQIQVQASDKVVECDGAGNTAALKAWLASNGGASASDTCGKVTWSHNFVALSDGCGATGAATVTFTATDECGNTSTTTATFTIVDQTAPSITTPASNKTVECDGAGNTAALKAWLAANGGASASDVCGKVTWSHNFTALSDGCGATGSATVTFTATDECGNTSTTTATFTIVDTTPPSIATTASNKVVECDGAGNVADLSAWLASNGGASSSDVCGKITWSHNFTALSDLCGATGSATVTFTATDECGNTSVTTATFTIVDTTAPTLSSDTRDILPREVPITFTVSAQDVCGSATPTITKVTTHAVNGSGKTIDKSASTVYTVTGNKITIKDSGGVGTVFTLYASAVDACGNSNTATYVVNVLRPANEGVGNGVDGNTPGHANNGGNDDPGQTPGNPGAKGKGGG